MNVPVFCAAQQCTVAYKDTSKYSRCPSSAVIYASADDCETRQCSRSQRRSPPLPRYFFNMSDGADLPDDEGIVLPDLTTARTQAIKTAGELLESAVEVSGPVPNGE